jgi:hypothetical protein
MDGPEHQPEDKISDSEQDGNFLCEVHFHILEFKTPLDSKRLHCNEEPLTSFNVKCCCRGKRFARGDRKGDQKGRRSKLRLESSSSFAEGRIKCPGG